MLRSNVQNITRGVIDGELVVCLNSSAATTNHIANTKESKVASRRMIDSIKASWEIWMEAYGYCLKAGAEATDPERVAERGGVTSSMLEKSLRGAVIPIARRTR